MKLTNHLRDVILSAMLADVPQINYVEKAAIALQARLLKKFPPNVMAIYNDKSIRHFLNKNRFYINHIGYIYCYSEDDKLTTDDLEILKEIVKLNSEQDESLKELRNKLRDVLLSFTTTQKLAYAFPEFVSYMPKEPIAATDNLPAVLSDIVNDFVNLGWKKPAEALVAVA